MGSTSIRASYYYERLVAIVLALLAVLSPLYIDRKPAAEVEEDEDGTISFVSWAWLPLLLVVLIISINMSCYLDRRLKRFDPYWIHRVGGSPCGILALLMLLALVLKCKASSISN
ncbi:uncharacterized protein LOC122059584 [Macadamia integrifolia]|uniref:uncharacterized protein LOC122059584 n=1 Tax=Macadamia integrifolia TaxID=60698 RepID=UPI001C52DBAC|nr:uncharacterized protein LOC122059584 [Macadamia integrifolia]